MLKWRRKKIQTLLFSPPAPPKHKGEKGGGQPAVLCSFGLNKTPDGLVPKMGRVPPSRKRQHRSGPCPGTPASPPLIPSGENVLRLLGQGCGVLCSGRQLATIPSAEGFPCDQRFPSHWVTVNDTLNLALHGGHARQGRGQTQITDYELPLIN